MKNVMVFILFLSLSTLCFVQAQAGVGISPPRIEMTASESASLTQEVVVDNPSDNVPFDVTISLGDALLKPDSSPIFLEPGSHPGSLANWISLSDFQLTLDPQASSTLTYSVQVPDDAPAGTYWSVIFFEAVPSGQAETNEGIGISSRVRVGHLVYVHVGELTKGGEIEGVRYSLGREPELRVMFRNSGNALVRPSGSIELRSEQGELMQTVELPASAVFPGHASEVVGALKEPLASGNYIALAVLDYGAATVTAGEGRIEVP